MIHPWYIPGNCTDRQTVWNARLLESGFQLAPCCVRPGSTLDFVSLDLSCTETELYKACMMVT